MASRLRQFTLLQLVGVVVGAPLESPALMLVSVAVTGAACGLVFKGGVDLCTRIAPPSLCRMPPSSVTTQVPSGEKARSSRPGTVRSRFPVHRSKMPM